MTSKDTYHYTTKDLTIIIVVIIIIIIIIIINNLLKVNFQQLLSLVYVFT